MKPTTTTFRFDTIKPERVAARSGPSWHFDQMRDHNRDWALRLGDAGIAVLPCDSNKKPLVKWRNFSSCDPEAIAMWWNQHPGALPGIDLAKCDLFVLDGDRHGGPDGRTALRKLLRQQP